MAYKWNFKELEAAKITRWLGRLRREAVVSPDLRAAIVEAERAMKAGNYALAEDLTAVKSYVTGSYPPHGGGTVTPFTEADSLARGDHFWEDGIANEEKFGETVYGILDSMTHELSIHSGNIPAGAVILTSPEVGKITMHERGQPVGESPTLRLMREEHQAILDRVAADAKRE
jgi:hypothetical protein